ncbi:Dihydropteroate synthase [Roseivivax sp. THAF40]|uniref:dihydropteroate synthase n=1 Tax=unclassified Roseivivax TaxID=2639302 RepID=UPI00126942CB|nr:MULTISPECIES: dihydropteroate synthase [unclassified Roseivivax]QFS83285.1 Dihydropteroate synthase [Roseivivax sp. THAF197b]QFT47029.1 Dihydropteroate synthase [Roseivivax sp. THAF40]
MLDAYYRPILSDDPARPAEALSLAGTALWFTHVERLSRDAAPRRLPAADLPADWHAALTTPRAPIAGVAMDRPQIMGILNATPDSFSDGGQFDQAEAARRHATAMSDAGAAFIDIGGESTRPGATEVPAEEEARRIMPLIRDLAQRGDAAISVDTRKAGVADAALKAGAALLNDVSGLDFDAEMAPLAARTGAPICVMHSQGGPEIMQNAPQYGDVTLDIYDHLAARIARLTELGLPRDRIVVDPGIGFGKTLEHNLTLLRQLAVFHGLGCPILLGVSRKGFIGTISGERVAAQRAPGSIAAALAGISQGVQILRVHDVAETAQALSIWEKIKGTEK